MSAINGIKLFIQIFVFNVLKEQIRGDSDRHKAPLVIDLH